MSDYKVVYLIVERQYPEQPPLWRMAGIAFVCRDGSLNLRFDMFPGLRFNVRDPKFDGPTSVDDVHPNNNSIEQPPVPSHAPANGKADHEIPF